LIDLESLKDAEHDVIGELISNMSGAVAVHPILEDGKSKSEALNAFMSRVVGAIDK
jgi:hypothetical protein